MKTAKHSNRSFMIESGRVCSALREGVLPDTPYEATTYGVLVDDQRPSNGSETDAKPLQHDRCLKSSEAGWMAVGPATRGRGEDKGG